MIKHDAVNGQGRPVPMFINLVSRSLPKLADARDGDRARILAGGFIEATRYAVGR